MKAMMTAVVAGGVLVAAGVATVGHDEPTRTATPRVQSKRAVAALVTPNSLYAVTGAPPVVVFGANGSLGIGGGHIAAGPGATSSDRPTTAAVDHDRSQMSTSLFFAPTTFARPAATPSSDSRSALSVAPVPGVGMPGLFSPTGAFLGLIGPGGLLIGDGVLPGQNGGWLIGNGGDGGDAGPTGTGGDGGTGGSGTSTTGSGKGGNGGDGGEGGVGGGGGEAGHGSTSNGSDGSAGAAIS